MCLAPLSFPTHRRLRSPQPRRKDRAHAGDSLGSGGEILIPFELKAYKRGTLNTPGEEVPAGTGQFGYETVMMENADSESSATSTSRDCDDSGASANLNTHRKANDDDLVKIVLKWPAGIKPAGASLKLLHDGMQVDATQTTADAAVSTSGPSRLNFYKADGTRITNPASDLQIADLANAPASSYLSKILTDGEVTILIEGADSFGDLPANRITRLGGALLKWEFTQGTTITNTKLLVYRGGFLVWRQATGAPGSLGQLEFRDGKGRINQRTGGKGNEFKTDVWDSGNILATWTGRSGRLTDGSQGSPGPGLDYDVTDRRAGRLPCGHLPPGWWWVGPYRSVSAVQDNQSQSNGTIKQGGYCRWLTDDGPNPYQQQYRFIPGTDGPTPATIKFKFDLFAIAGTSAYGRDGFQIHPDGEKNGTAGCIGIQSVNDCKSVQKILRAFHSLKLRSVRE